MKIIGNKDGEIRLFRKNEVGYAYRWSVSGDGDGNKQTVSGTWVEIGEVMGEKPVVGTVMI